MSINHFLKAAFDGAIQGITVCLLNIFIPSIYAETLTFDQLLTIGGLCAIPVVISYFLFLFKIYSNAQLVTFTLFSALCSIISTLVLTVIHQLLPVTFFALQKEVNEAHGIVMIFSTGVFVLLSAIFRLVIFVVFLIRNICIAKHNKM